MKTEILSTQFIFCGEVIFEEESRLLSPRCGDRFTIEDAGELYAFQIVAVRWDAVSPDREKLISKELTVKVWLATDRSEDFQLYKNKFASQVKP